MNQTSDPTTVTPAGTETIVAEGDPVAGDPAALTGRIRSALERHGRLLVAHRLTISDFEAIGNRLGEIELRTDIVIDPERERRQRAQRTQYAARPGVYQASALDMHTDRPSAAILAWYCVEPDPRGGANLLIDTNDLPAHFSAAEIAELGRIEVGCIVPDPILGGEKVHYNPLVSPRRGGLAVYYVPWLIEPPQDEPLRGLLERFKGYLKAKEQRDLLTICLDRGQSLFIDNRRMLHGRGALPEVSRRHLVRLYIRARDGGSDGL